MKVLHIVENLHRGAVETWLVRMLDECRKMRPEDEWTFYCALGQPGRHDGQVRAFGGRIIYSPVPFSKTFAFLRALRQTLKKEHFDVMHCHHDLLSGFYLLAAAGLPVTRIVHVHNTDEALPTPSKLKRWVLTEPLRKTCIAASNKVVGISTHTLATFLRGRAPRPARDRVLYYGYDFSECFREPLDSSVLKNSLRFSGDTRLVLFLGRLDPVKNPLGALNIFAELYRRRKDVACLFAGEGALAEVIRSRAVELGISDQVMLLGWCERPLALMQTCDLFLFPRREENTEGFGFAVLEAQAAGLPVLTSYGVSEEVLVFPERCRRLSVSQNAEVWAELADELLQLPRPRMHDIVVTLKQTMFSKEASAQSLLALYDESTDTGRTGTCPTSFRGRSRYITVI